MLRIHCGHQLSFKCAVSSLQLGTADLSDAHGYSHHQACFVVPASGPIPRGLTILKDRDLRQHGISSLSELWDHKPDPRAYISLRFSILQCMTTITELSGGCVLV